MKAIPIVFLLLFVLPTLVEAQIDEIKKESSNHYGGKSASGDSGGSSSSIGMGGSIIVDLMFGGFVDWQRYKLKKREINREITSLEVLLQGSVNPLNNSYLMNPRIRGSWGLFSMDFRFNYLIERDVEGFRHIRTSDWQILQFNLVTTRNVIFRLGGGVLSEAFSDEKNAYSEWTAGLQINSNDHFLGGTTEYRDSEVRREWNAHLRYKVMEAGVLHGFATAGIVYQRYYSSIDIWGLQAGFTFKLY